MQKHPLLSGLLGLCLWGGALWAQVPRDRVASDLVLTQFDRTQQYHQQLEADGATTELQASEQFFYQVRQQVELFLSDPTRATWMMYRAEIQEMGIEARTPAYAAYFLSVLSQFLNRQFNTAERRKNFLDHLVTLLDVRDVEDHYHLSRLINPLRGEAGVMAEIERTGVASSWKLFMPLQVAASPLRDFLEREGLVGSANDFSQVKVEQDHGQFYRVGPEGLESEGWMSPQMREGVRLNDFLESEAYSQRQLTRLMQQHGQQADPEESYFVPVVADLEAAVERAVFASPERKRTPPWVITEVSLPLSEVFPNMYIGQGQHRQYLVKDQIDPGAITRVWTPDQVLDQHERFRRETALVPSQARPSIELKRSSAEGRQAVDQLFSQLETMQDRDQVRNIFHRISQQLETRDDLSNVEKEEYLFRQLQMLALPKFEVVRNELAEVPASLYSTSRLAGLPLLIKHMAQAALNSENTSEVRKIFRHTDEYLVSHALYLADAALKDTTKAGFVKSYDELKRYLLKRFITSGVVQKVFSAGEGSSTVAVRNYKVVSGMLKLQAILMATMLYTQWWRTGKLDVKQLALSWISILIPQALIHIGAYLIWVKILHRNWQLKTFSGVGAVLTALEIGLTAYFGDELMKLFHRGMHQFSSVKDLKKKWAEFNRRIQDEGVPADDGVSYYLDEMSPAFQSFRNFLMYSVYEANQVYLQDFEQMRRIHDKLYAASLERQRRLQRFIQAKARLALVRRVYVDRGGLASHRLSPEQQRLGLWHQIERGRPFEQITPAQALFMPFTSDIRTSPLSGVLVPLTPEKIYANAKYDLFRMDQEISGLLAHPEWKLDYETKAQSFHDEQMQIIEQVQRSLRDSSERNFTARSFLDFRRTGSKKDFEWYRRMKAQASEDPEVIQATPVSNLIQHLSIVERTVRTVRDQPESERQEMLLSFFQDEGEVLRMELAQLMRTLEDPLVITLDPQEELELETEFNLQNDVLPDLTQWQTDYVPRSELIDASAFPL